MVEKFQLNWFSCKKTFNRYNVIARHEAIYMDCHASFHSARNDKAMNYYIQETFLTTPIGNNTITFWKRKEKGSDCILRVPPLIHGSLEDVVIARDEAIHYEYISEKWKLISSFWLESLVQMNQWDKDMYIIDNHNHAFYCRWKSYLEWKTQRWSHLIHIDQHSDLNVPIATSNKQQAIEGKKTCSLQLAAYSQLDDIAIYTNEVLDIASFIKPAKEIWLISDYEMILTEYSLLQFQVSFKPVSLQFSSLIVDIDLDFRAPEMGIEYYYQTIKKVRQLIALPDVGCITIATSPTYIHQQRALQVLHDLLD